MSMRARVAAFVIVIVVIIAGIVGYRYLNSGGASAGEAGKTAAATDRDKQKNPTGDKTLIVYFSLPGQTSVEKGKDPVDLKVGTTAQVAQLIHAQVGGDLVELKAKDPYPADLKEVKARAKKELKEQVFPELADSVPDVAQYSKIFIGYPIWLDEQPMVVQRFLRDAHIGTQHVYPFLTSVHTGYGKSGPVFAKYAPDAQLAKAFELTSAQVVNDPAGTKQAVGEWVKTLNLK